MSTFQLVKSMLRTLTDDEKNEVAEYVRTETDKNILEVIAHFEERFQTPVTKHCIMKIMLAMQFGEYGGK